MAGLIVHEWFEKYGGAEKVVESLINVFPGADVFSLWGAPSSSEKIRSARQSQLSLMPRWNRKIFSLPLMPLVWRALDISEYDWIVTSSHLFAHQVGAYTGESSNRFVYCHTPARYLWEPGLDKRGDQGLLQLVAEPLKRLDRELASRHKQLAVNSIFVQRRVENVWGLSNADVIHPPVEADSLMSKGRFVNNLDLAEERQFMAVSYSPYVLFAGRLVEYKQPDMVLRLAKKLGVTCIIAGNGPMLGRLRHLAAALSVRAHFVVSPSANLMFALAQEALCVYFPGVEDFGILSVECLAVGAKIIGNRVGGFSEIVTDTVTGFTVNPLDIVEVASAVQNLNRIDLQISQNSARRFDRDNFESKVQAWVGAP
jgi:glycosyltransferase involved in cell wall biosynthesis